MQKQQLEPCKNMKHECSCTFWIDSKVLVDKVVKERFLNLGDIDLQVHLTLDKKEVLIYLYVTE